MGGRPQKAFEDISRKSKRRRVNDFIENLSAEEVTSAAKVLMPATGKRNAANMMSELCKSPQRVSSKIKEL